MPISVMTLMEKIETSVTMVMARTRAKAPKMATTPTKAGIRAAATLPKNTRHKRITIGIEITSARVMSAETCLFTSRKTAHAPPTLVLSPLASTWGLTLSKRAAFSSCVVPLNETMTRVACWSPLINVGDGVWYQVVTCWVDPLGSPEMTFWTDSRKAGSLTFIEGLE